MCKEVSEEVIKNKEPLKLHWVSDINIENQTLTDFSISLKELHHFIVQHDSYNRDEIYYHHFIHLSNNFRLYNIK